MVVVLAWSGMAESVSAEQMNSSSSGFRSCDFQYEAECCDSSSYVDENEEADS